MPCGMPPPCRIRRDRACILSRPPTGDSLAQTSPSPAIGLLAASRLTWVVAMAGFFWLLLLFAVVGDYMSRGWVPGTLR